MAYKQEMWDEAKKKCHIGDEEIHMAKEMGLNPKSLIKNIPNKSEMWKAPVKDWIHDMYDKRQRKSRQKAKRRATACYNIGDMAPLLRQYYAPAGKSRRNLIG